MPQPLCGPCLPWFVAGANPGQGLDGPAMLSKADREAWLEAEVSRLGAKFQDLVETNMSLSRELTAQQAKVEQLQSEEDEQVVQTAGGEEEEEEGEKEERCREKPSLGRKPTITIKDKPEVSIYNVTENEGGITRNSSSDWLSGRVNISVMRGSLFGMKLWMQAMIYALAVAGVLFVLIAASTRLGAGDTVEESTAHGVVEEGPPQGGWVDTPQEDSSHSSTAEPMSGHEDGRRLFGAVPKLLYNIAFSLTGAGLMTLLMNSLKQPLILGYLLGGALVGPEVLKIVDSHHDIAELSNLGLIFLLFMIGMELDIKELLKMGKVVLVTGFLQFPVCAGAMILVFLGLQAAGLSFGAGQYATMYCGLTCGISSTMIVAKVLGEKGEMGSPPGRLTIGILIFQDIWAIVVLAIQPNLANPKVLGILRTFLMIAVLIVVALAYAKFVMPAVLFYASKSTELMFVLSLAWCFFICCTAILPFIGLSMELAALIAGVALATFPYSAEFNGKIKFIRDFFITLFFAGLGMQIPAPTFGAIAKGVVVAVVVLLFRWLGIFLVVRVLGGGGALAAVSTINLSQISEFALVICSIGMSFGHVEADTMTIIIWTFAILAISASYLIGYNSQIYRLLRHLGNRMLCRKELQGDDDSEGHDHEHELRDILLLGFHRTASMLVAEVEERSPEILKRIHIIDINQHIMPQLREKGVKCTYGDYKEPDVLEHCHHGEARIVICTIPDSLLQGTSNAQLLKVTREVWPQAHCIVTADNPYQAQQLYQDGADYVLRMAKLCAERLREMLSEHFSKAADESELKQVFEHFRKRDRDHRKGSQFLSVRV